MNIAILGKSQINSMLERQFSLAGITTLIFENLNDIQAVSGERGSFIIKNKDKIFKASYILVTEEPSLKLDNANRQNGVLHTISLRDSPDLDKLPYSKMPVVFILDYPSDSTALMTRRALEKAIRLSRRKMNAVIFSKFMRTAGDNLESLYKNARNLGVVFFKYNSISVDYKSDEEIFHILAKDMSGSLEISTNTTVLAGEEVYSDAFLKVIKLLKLKQDSNGYVREDCFFLFPSLTSRKGIYFTNMKATSGSNSEYMAQVEYILADIKSEMQMDSKAYTSNINGILSDTFDSKEYSDEAHPEEYSEEYTEAYSREYAQAYEKIFSEKYAQVDSAKCVFCYTCYRACPHQAMAPDYENSVMKNLHKGCYGCGICSSICPANAVTMVGNDGTGNNDFENVDSKITKGCIDIVEVSKGIEADNGKKTTPRSLKVFCCENSGVIAFGKIAGNLEQEGLRVEVTSVSCGGELSAEIISLALKDFDKVLVAVCMDNACRHFDGNKRAKLYVERVREMLKASGIDENRAQYMQLSHAMPMVLNGYIREMV